MERVDKMNIIAIVQARMGSERLPGKVIKPIIGKPMILHVLDRLSKSKYINQIILATSTSERELPLIDIVSGAGYEVFRGEEDNVLKRYRDANKRYGGDIIIRVTGDCPLIDPQIVDNVISYYLMYNYDYVRLDVPNSFVRGFDIEILSSLALEKSYKEVFDINNKSYQEHVTSYIYKNPDKFKIGYVKGNEFYNKNYRICVDTEEDFQTVNKIYTHFNDEYIMANNIIKYLDNTPETSKINQNINQKI